MRNNEFPSTLREFIMNMKTRDGNPIFTSVDFSFVGVCVLFIFPKAYEDETQNRIADLPSYAFFKCGLCFLQKYFTPEAYERAEEAPWNEEGGRAVSKLGEEFDNILKDCAGLSWLKDAVENQETHEEQNQERTKKKPALFNARPNYESSLETFGMNTAESNKRSVPPEKDPQASKKKK